MNVSHLLAAPALALAAFAAAPAAAKDTAPCARDMICATDPATIVAAVQAAGYKAQLTTDNTGDPEIDSAANGYNFQILFYDCVDHKQCAAIQFRTSFKADPSYTLALVNRWNRDRRFLRAYLNDSGTLLFDHDVSTIGGINKTNFTDLINWMASTMGEVDKFLSAPPAAKK